MYLSLEDCIVTDEISTTDLLELIIQNKLPIRLDKMELLEALELELDTEIEVKNTDFRDY